MDRKLAVRPLVACLMLSLLAACVSTDPAGDNAAATADAAAASASADGGSASASASSSSSMVSNATGAALDTVLAGDWRTPKWVARDQYRHPKETLSFFLLKPDQTVIEITPGGGWYAELLAPYLRDNGKYVAAVWDDNDHGPARLSLQPQQAVAREVRRQRRRVRQDAKCASSTRRTPTSARRTPPTSC